MEIKQEESKIKNKRTNSRQIRQKIYTKYRNLLNVVMQERLPVEPVFKDFENFYRFVKPTYLRMARKEPGKKIVLMRLNPKNGLLKTNISLGYQRDCVFLYKKNSKVIQENRNTIKVFWKDKLHTLNEIARATGKTLGRVRSSYYYAFDNNDMSLFYKYIEGKHVNKDAELYEYQGELKSLKDLEKISAEKGAFVKRQTIHARIKRLGFSVEDAVITPSQPTKRKRLT